MAGGCSVLLVDDDRTFREAVATALRAHGVCVAQAADGWEALERLRAASLPTVILLDLTMPGLDGEGFRRAQRRDEELARVPVILCSAEPDLAGRAEQLGVRHFVSKPVDLDRLVALVRRHGRRDGE